MPVRNLSTSFSQYLVQDLACESESEVAQWYPTLCDPMDCSLPGSSLHGILQARILEWVAISFSRGFSRPRDQTRVSRIPGRRFNAEPPGNLPLPDAILNGARFHILIVLCHLCIFFGEVFVKFFGPCFNQAVVFLLLSFKSSLYILDSSLLSHVSFVIFSHSLCLLIFSSLFFTEQKILIIMASSLSIFLSWIVHFIFYLKIHRHLQGPLNFLLCYLLGVFYFCILHFSM